MDEWKLYNLPEVQHRPTHWGIAHHAEGFMLLYCAHLHFKQDLQICTYFMHVACNTLMY